MRVNTTKQKLLAGQVVFGGHIAGFAPDLVELLGFIGYDYVWLDCEHGSLSIDQVEHMVRAAEVVGITPMIRVLDHSEAMLGRYLDRGIQGVIVPHVSTREDAEKIAGAALYFPEGHRGASIGRIHEYNVAQNRIETMRVINEQMLVIPMCEDVQAAENIEDIISVPGIDVIHVSTNDLSQSMGNPPASETRRLLIDVVRRTKAAGKWAGVAGNVPSDPASVAELIDAGATFITCSTLGLLRRGAEEYRREILSFLR